MAHRLIVVLLALLLLAPIVATVPRNPAAIAQDGDPVATDVEATPTVESTADTTGIEPSSPTPTQTATESATPSETATTPSTATASSVATATPTEPVSTPTPTVDAGGDPGSTADLKVRLSCTTNPEKIWVTNNGTATIALTGLGTLYGQLSAEPFALNQTLLPGATRIYRSGPAANVGIVLTTSYIFTNSAYQLDGVLMNTSVGDVTATCPPKPDPVVTNPGKLTDLAITLSCRTYAESIKVVNEGTGYFLLKSIGTTFDVSSREPYQVGQVLAPGATALFQSGTGAVSGTILTKSYIFTNTAWEKDGARILTSVGTAAKACDKKPPVDAEHWVEVNLSTQFLKAWNGSTLVNSTYVSTGRPGFDTPTGTFRILVKYRYDDMEGTIGGEYYNVPDVPWTMYFTNYGHALHGAYWHNDFGRVRSHGCVNLPLWFAEWLYYWLPYGGRVVIHY